VESGRPAIQHGFLRIVAEVLLPSPRGQLFQPLERMPIDSLEHVDQDRVRVDIVEHASGDQALRQQLTTDTQKGLKPAITAADRAFWVFLSPLVGMERDSRHRPAQHCRPLASQGLQALLTIDLEARTRTPSDSG
jgi:hypothetical protein